MSAYYWQGYTVLQEEDDTAGQTVTARDQALDYARTASEGFVAAADYLRNLPDDAWDGPTGCEDWNMQFLGGHITGEAVWFANVAGGVVRNEEPLPGEVYEDLKGVSGDEMATRTERAAADIQSTIEEAGHEHLQQTVDLGFMQWPLWLATFVSAFEAVVHGWDTRAKREERATIPAPWARVLATGIPRLSTIVAHRAGIEQYPGTYLLRVGDGVGPIAVVARDGKLTVEERETDSPDVTLHLNPDQYVRLVAGRFHLTAPEGQEIHIEGDRERATGINRVFGGVANE